MKTGPKPRDLAERFWEKVDRTGGPAACWPWLAATDSHGRGQFNVHGKPQKAPRVAYALTYNEPGALFVCHHCDNGLCCNPAHLFLGTHQDNMDDMVSKGRGAKGITSGLSKLTDDAVRSMRAEHYNEKQTVRAIAARYGVSLMTAHSAIRAHTWKHVQ
jgi:hypothetical protein